MISTSDSHAALQRRLNGITAFVIQRSRGFCGYSDSDVASRLIQKLAELSTFAYPSMAAEQYRQTGLLPSDLEVINCNGVLIDGISEVRLTPKKFLFLLSYFFLHWGYTLLAIIASLRFKNSNKKMSLFYGLALQDIVVDGDDEYFLNYCRNCQIQPLASSQFLVIQSPVKINSRRLDHVSYSKDPLNRALKLSGMRLQLWVHTLGCHVLSMASFLFAVYKFPVLALLWRDVSSHTVAAVLNKNGHLDDVIFTNSAYSSQPLWFWALPKRVFYSHILWYSQNSYPISYLDEVSAHSIVNFQYMRADIQWVWTKGFKNFLEQICPRSSYRVVGPIIWKLPSKKKLMMDANLKIIVFDITPPNEEFEKKFGLLRNYYSEKIMSKFIEDIIEVTSNISKIKGEIIEVVLKHKRDFIDIHSSEYIKNISDLSDTRVLKLVSNNSNIYELINTGALIIAAPYSSPVYIALDIGIPAFWYDPTGTLHWKLGVQEAPLIQGREQLFTKLTEIFL